ncbi:hypothetical protein [Streptomyces sp. NPDC056883]|uniref:hypothetical protein n=1 Tax=Streptomyces sp. NPDC056883 TaxID=3345959 RepID=UPI0036A88B72
MNATASASPAGPSLFCGEVFHVDPNGPEVHNDPVATAVRHLVPYLSLRAVLAVPTYQFVNDTSRYWVFGQQVVLDAANAQLMAKAAEYLLVEAGPAPDRKISIVRQARPVTEWPSLKDIGRLACFLPVPDRQNVDGQSEQWVFHVKDGQLMSRKTAIQHDGAHTDTILKNDLPVAEDWPSLDGIGLLTSFVPVPGKQDADGESHFWVHALDSAWNPTVRTIAIKNGSHKDIVIDWDSGKQSTYFQGIQNCVRAGEMLTQAVVQGPTGARTEMIGLTLGGQAAGTGRRKQWKVGFRVVELDTGTYRISPLTEDSDPRNPWLAVTGPVNEALGRTSEDLSDLFTGAGGKPGTGITQIRNLLCR